MDLMLRTSLILAVAAVVARCLRNAAPSTRHLVWHMSIVLVLVAPVLSALPSAVTFELPIAAPRVPGALAGWVPAATPTMATTGTLVAPLTPDSLRSMSFLVSLTVAGWFLFGWVCSGLSVRQTTAAPAQWVAESRRVAARLSMEAVEIRQSRHHLSPHVAGLLRSVVVFPTSALEWTPEERYAALVHELTHIRRRDRRTQALAQLACALYWFNPLMWFAAASLGRERERACDGEVLRCGARPSAYAKLLLDLARRPEPQWLPAAALSMARPSAIEGRLVSILAEYTRTPRRWTARMLTACLVLAAAVILGARPSASASVAGWRTPGAQFLLAPENQLDSVMDVDARRPQPSLTSVFVQALGDSSPQVREQAALGLALTPGDDVIDPLLAALKDPDAQVREKAAIGLSFRTNPRIVEPLVEAMTDRDSQVREKAAIALGAIPDPRALDALRAAVTDPDAQVREKVLAGLRLTGRRP